MNWLESVLAQVNGTAESDPSALGQLSAAAELLIAHARREDAIALVSEAVEVFDDRRALLLLARINLESGTKEGAVAAIKALDLWRCLEPWDLDGVVLLRGALQVLGRTFATSKLDRDLRWSSCSATSPRHSRGADFGRNRRNARGAG